ncbi:hypothetical protein B0H12DRAFT_1225272 [Mycena haematopus]|nr:hypothetical protein B0H12DRAFT_1225272 [Mycena haematopus]
MSDREDKAKIRASHLERTDTLGSPTNTVTQSACKTAARSRQARFTGKQKQASGFTRARGPGVPSSSSRDCENSASSPPLEKTAAGACGGSIELMNPEVRAHRHQVAQNINPPTSRRRRMPVLNAAGDGEPAKDGRNGRACMRKYPVGPGACVCRARRLGERIYVAWARDVAEGMLVGILVLREVERARADIQQRMMLCTPQARTAGSALCYAGLAWWQWAAASQTALPHCSRPVLPVMGLLVVLRDASRIRGGACRRVSERLVRVKTRTGWLTIHKQIGKGLLEVFRVLQFIRFVPHLYAELLAVCCVLAVMLAVAWESMQVATGAEKKITNSCKAAFNFQPLPPIVPRNNQLEIQTVLRHSIVPRYVCYDQAMSML